MSRGRVVHTVWGVRVIPSMNRAPAFTYFAQCGQYVKVGCSSNVSQRLKTLASPSGRRSLICPDDLPFEPLRLLGMRKGGYDSENAAHCELFGHFPDSYACGEWFHATPDVLAWIAENTSALSTP